MAAPRTPKLERQLVAETALRLLNDVGLERLSLRLIAGELGVKAPALYWHFKDKQALLDEMATEMMRRLTVPPAPPGADWREIFRARIREFRAHLLRYRDGARVYSGSRFADTSYAAVLESNLRLLTDAGFTPRAAARAWLTAYSYLIGYVIEEQAMGPSPFGEHESIDLRARAERLADHPMAAEVGWEIFQDFDQGFETGLTAVVAGIDATLAPRARPA